MNYCQLISLINPCKEISMSEVIRSVVGVLCGSQSSLFVWREESDRFVVALGVTPTHFGETLFTNYCHYYCKYGTAVKKLLEFCYACDTDDEHVLSYTINAFRSTLRFILANLVKRLNAIADHFHDRDVSLIDLKYVLDSDQNDNLLLTIEVLWEMFVEVRDSALTQTSVCLTTAILNACYSRLDFQQRYTRCVVYTLFVATIKPTIDYLDAVLSMSSFADPHNEFIFIEFDCDFDAMFWQNCVQLREGSLKLPTFLAKKLDLIIMAAKSRLMIKKITLKEERSYLLFDRFVENLIENTSLYCSQTKAIEEHMYNFNGTSNAYYCVNEMNSEIIPKSLEISLAEKNRYDSKLNFFDIYSHRNTHYTYLDNRFDFTFTDRNDFRELYLPQTDIKPIELIIREAIAQVFTDVCLDICANLTDLIGNEYNKYLTNICDYFLMRSSGDLFSYCTQLFHAILSMNSSEIDAIILNDQTFDAMDEIKPFISCVNLSHTPLEFLNNVYLIYIDICWPFNTMFSLDVIGVFNKVFQLLLKVKYSKWILDQLTMSSQFKRNQLSNSLYLTKFKLQHSVHRLHNHFMYTIDSRVSHAIDNLKKARNFDQFLDAHNNFVTNLKHCIFYKQDILRNVVRKLIKMCSQLYEVWTSDDNEMPSFESVNNDIDRCVYLLDCYYDVVNQIDFNSLK